MEEGKNVEYEESSGLTFKDILYTIRKHWIAIVAFVFSFTIAGFVWSKLETPVYQSTGTMLVSYESSGTSDVTRDYTFSNYISGTYVVFIKEDIVLDRVSEKVHIPTGILRGNTSVSNSSLVIKVSYTSSDKNEAKEVTQAIIETAQEVADTTELVDGTEKPLYHLLYDNLKVLSQAKDGSKISHTVRNTIIGFAVGIVLAIIYIVIREILDTTFKSSEEIERLLNIPVIAGIPDYYFDDEKGDK